MTITSLRFMGFVILAVLLFVVFPRKERWISLLISSIAFYWICARWVIAFSVCTSAVVWFAAGKIDEIGQLAQKQQKDPGLDREERRAIRQVAQRKRKRYLLAALLLSVGALCVFKFFHYFAGAFSMIAGFFAGEKSLDILTLAMPLGISYYTFSTVGYLLDIYWKRYESENSFLRFYLYTIYFPHILQGPISRYSHLGRELKKPELYFTWDHFITGMEHILMGCFKKLVIADRASVFVSNTLLKGDLPGSIYLLAMALDALQIYADFSGYMDIVRGISIMFDVDLERNFHHPFLAGSVPEFWRRWHMSLGSWFRDYVYYPIAVSGLVKHITRKTRDWKSARLKTAACVIIPVMTTWILTGLWHGTGSGYLMWGFYYGILVLLSVTFEKDFAGIREKWKGNTRHFLYRALQSVKIFLIFMGGRFLAATMTLAHRKEILRNLFCRFWGSSFTSYGLDRKNFLILICGVLLLIAVAAIETREDVYDWFHRRNKLLRALVLYILFFSVFLLGVYGTVYDTSYFMYQQF